MSVTRVLYPAFDQHLAFFSTGRQSCPNRARREGALQSTDPGQKDGNSRVSSFRPPSVPSPSPTLVGTVNLVTADASQVDLAVADGTKAFPPTLVTHPRCTEGGWGSRSVCVRGWGGGSFVLSATQFCRHCGSLPSPTPYYFLPTPPPPPTTTLPSAELVGLLARLASTSIELSFHSQELAVSQVYD